MSRTHEAHGDRGFIEDQREFFDTLVTQDWDTYSNAHWDKTRQFEVQEILRVVGTPRKILDVGCGCGYHDVRFAEVPGVESALGIDSSPQSISQADRHYPHPKVHRCVADIFAHTDVVERFGQFDLVASFQVIEHLSKPQAFLDACAQCAADGGFVAVVTPNRQSLQNRLRQLLGQPPLKVDPLHFAEYTVAELAEMGAKIGLRSVAHFGHTVHLTLRGVTLSSGTTALGLRLGQRFPRCANVIGVIFRKDG